MTKNTTIVQTVNTATGCGTLVDFSLQFLSTTAQFHILGNYHIFFKVRTRKILRVRKGKIPEC